MDRIFNRRHVYVGEEGTKAVDGFKGFQCGNSYLLHYTRQDSGTVVIDLDHRTYGPKLVLSAAEFEAWFKRE